MEEFGLAIGMLNMLGENERTSKVEGRRNWLIRVQELNGKNRIVFAGGWGEGKRQGWMIEQVSYIVEHNVRWFEFTYKADYLKVLNNLKENGFTEW